MIRNSSISNPWTESVDKTLSKLLFETRIKLAIKSSRKRDMESQIHEIQMMAERRKQKEAQEMARIRAKQEHDRKLLRFEPLNSKF